MYVDFAIIGGGIIGLTTANALRRQHPDASIAILEKEQMLGAHQTGHNSGVLHSGIYYRPGSLKARLCIEGRRTMVRWCEDHGISFRLSGKVVVATDENQLVALERIQQRAVVNGVSGSEMIDRNDLRQLEPHASGVAALWVPETGVVDFRDVARKLGNQLRRSGVEIHTGAAVSKAHRDKVIHLHLSDGTAITASRVISCAGLQGDQVARAIGLNTDIRIVSFRGEYWQLRRPELVRSLIYPVPDPRFPFLGLHYTKYLDDTVKVGPSAVPALSREGYSWLNADWRHLMDSMRFSGLRRLARRYWRTGAVEVSRSLIKPLLVRAAQRLLPAVTSRDLTRTGAGVRAQAVDPDGIMIDDFVIIDDGQAAAVLNAPSPGATAAFAIADEILRQIQSPP